MVKQYEYDGYDDGDELMMTMTVTISDDHYSSPGIAVIEDLDCCVTRENIVSQT